MRRRSRLRSPGRPRVRRPSPPGSSLGCWRRTPPLPAHREHFSGVHDPFRVHRGLHAPEKPPRGRPERFPEVLRMLHADPVMMAEVPAEVQDRAGDGGLHGVVLRELLPALLSGEEREVQGGALGVHVGYVAPYEPLHARAPDPVQERLAGPFVEAFEVRPYGRGLDGVHHDPVVDQGVPQVWSVVPLPEPTLRGLGARDGASPAVPLPRPEVIADGRPRALVPDEEEAASVRRRYAPRRLPRGRYRESRLVIV